jgi:hypothetical protein
MLDDIVLVPESLFWSGMIFTKASRKNAKLVIPSLGTVRTILVLFRMKGFPCR